MKRGEVARGIHWLMYQKAWDGTLELPLDWGLRLVLWTCCPHHLWLHSALLASFLEMFTFSTHRVLWVFPSPALQPSRRHSSRSPGVGALWMTWVIAPAYCLSRPGRHLHLRVIQITGTRVERRFPFWHGWYTDCQVVEKLWVDRMPDVQFPVHLTSSTATERLTPKCGGFK
jgi:hypothetical protein